GEFGGQDYEDGTGPGQLGTISYLILNLTDENNDITDVPYEELLHKDYRGKEFVIKDLNIDLVKIKLDPIVREYKFFFANSSSNDTYYELEYIHDLNNYLNNKGPYDPVTRNLPGAPLAAQSNAPKIVFVRADADKDTSQDHPTEGRKYTHRELRKKQLKEAIKDFENRIRPAKEQ
ncbi:13775_t:CDS:2, partial [Racocetra persica]